MVSSKETGAEAEVPPLAGVRVLVADDSAANRRFLEWCLERAGASVETVDDGTALLGALTVPAGRDAALVDPAPADIVLTDVEMPTLDGLTATRLLRRLGCSLPIVALTARAAPNDVDECLAAGCTAFGSKPIEAETLLSLVSELVHGDGAQRPTGVADASSAASATGTRPAPAAGATGVEAVAVDMLHSDFADDPDMAELIDAFVDGLATTIAGIEAALASGRLDELARLAHQVKGAGGSYGFPSLTDAARAVEADVRSGAAADALEAKVEHLAALCRAAIRARRTPLSEQQPTEGAA